MPVTTLTSKGQVTIPQRIREQLRWKAGDRLDFTVDKDGRVVVELLGGDARELRGILRRAGESTLSVEAMDEAIAEHLKAKHTSLRHKP